MGAPKSFRSSGPLWVLTRPWVYLIVTVTLDEHTEPNVSDIVFAWSKVAPDVQGSSEVLSTWEQSSSVDLFSCSLTIYQLINMWDLLLVVGVFVGGFCVFLN